MAEMLDYRRRVVRILAIGAFGLLLTGFTAWISRLSEPGRLVVLRVSGGRSEGMRGEIARALTREATRKGIHFRLVETAGSEAALDAVERGDLDVALIQGGLKMDRRSRVREVAALHVEPIHLLVKPELHAAVAEGLRALAGRTVNLGEPGSGTHCLASAVLRFASLSPGDGREAGTYRVETLDYARLIAEQDARRLPDAVFMVTSPPSAAARRLIRAHGYRLVPLPFGDAFSLGAVTEEANHSSIDQDDPATHVLREYISAAEIPAYAYQVEPPVPPTPVRTLGSRLLVVAGDRVESQSVYRLLETIFETGFAKINNPPLEPTLLDLPTQLPRHQGAEAYKHRNQTLVNGDVLDLADKLINVGGPVLGGLFLLLQWYRYRHTLRRDKRFESYILKVADIERRAGEIELKESFEFTALSNLQRELTVLKGEALSRFAAGELEGKELMSGFLTHVNDARTTLTRLLLHARDHRNARDRAE